MNAKRYEFHGDDLVESPDGCWMRSEDYDAALARATAAERTRSGEHVAMYGRALAAESRLADATELLEHCHRAFENSGLYPATTVELRRNIDNLSSSTPSPAAEPAADAEYHAQGNPPPVVLDAARAAYSEMYPAMLALAGSSNAPEHLRPQHPDTIALRECRAELEAQKRYYERALKDRREVESMLSSTRADLATARARIAELEADYEKSRLEMWNQAKEQAARIAQAVAELDETRWSPDGSVGAWAQTREGRNHGRVMNALELLRGNRT